MSHLTDLMAVSHLTDLRAEDQGHLTSHMAVVLGSMPLHSHANACSSPECERTGVALPRPFERSLAPNLRTLDVCFAHPSDPANGRGDELRGRPNDQAATVRVRVRLGIVLVRELSGDEQTRVVALVRPIEHVKRVRPVPTDRELGAIVRLHYLARFHSYPFVVLLANGPANAIESRRTDYRIVLASIVRAIVDGGENVTNVDYHHAIEPSATAATIANTITHPQSILPPIVEGRTRERPDQAAARAFVVSYCGSFVFESGSVASGATVTDFAKWERAAFAASSVIAHDVFFASIGRGNVMRRYARKRFGSTPSSDANSFGAYVRGESFDITNPLSGVGRNEHERMHEGKAVPDRWPVSACVRPAHIMTDGRSNVNVRSIRSAYRSLAFDRTNEARMTEVRLFDRRTFSSLTTTPPWGGAWGIRARAGKNPPSARTAERNKSTPYARQKVPSTTMTGGSVWR